MKWKGYILIEKIPGITEELKDIFRAEAIGIDQSNNITFRDSLNKQKSFIRIYLNKQGDEITTFLDSLGLNSYMVFGPLSYPENEINIRFKNSSTLALVNLQEIIGEFETPRD